MTIFIGIIVSIIIFSIIVLIHEYGHYKTARIFGIKVEEFGLGIPPRAKKLWKNTHGTLFSLNWIPLGGFVKIAGESEVFLEYYSKSHKLLSKEKLSKKIVLHDDIFDKNGKKIHKKERKYIETLLKNDSPGENFYEKNIFKKSLVLLAGVIMNFFSAGVIFSILLMVGVQPLGINTVLPNDDPSKILPSYEQAINDGLIIENPGVILSPIEDSLASQSGILTNDILLEVGSVSIGSSEEVQEIVSSSIGESLTFYIRRDSGCIDTSTVNRVCESTELLNIDIEIPESGRIGTYLQDNVSINENFEYTYPFFLAIKEGFLEVWYQSKLTLQGLAFILGNIISPDVPEDRSEALESVAGPIGIVSVITQGVQIGFTFIIILSALISVNLGVFNLLPIPALDGGRLLLLWLRSGVETFFGKSSIAVNFENIIHNIFFLLLIALSVLIAYNDVIRIFDK